MNLLKIMPVLIIPFFLTSCVGEEPNDAAYVTAVGIDKNKDEYVYTIQYANPTKISGGASEEGGKGGEIVENFSVGGTSLYSAINNANAILSKNLSLAHAKLVVVSEEMAKEGLYDLSETLSRSDEIRPDIYLAIAENSKKYIEEVKPVIELNPAKYYQLTYENNSYGGVPKNSALDYYFSNTTGFSDCVLPLAGTAETSKGNESGSEGGNESGGESKSPSENKKYDEAETVNTEFENKSKNYYAGQAGFSISNKSETVGMAVFKGEIYKEKLGSVDTELYNILSGKFNENYIDFYSGEKNPITLKVERKKAPDYKIDKENKTVSIKIKLEGELMSLPKKYKNERELEEMEEEISVMLSEAAESFANRMYQDDVDLFEIKGRLRTKFLTWQKYNEYCSNFNCKDWSFKVDGRIKISGTGIAKYR